MTPSSTTPPDRNRLRRRLAVKNLKRCPLCRAVNSRTSHECFVCGWSGAFESGSESLKEGLEQMLVRCPELFDLSTATPSRGGIQKRVASLLRRIFHRRIDISA